MTSKAKTTKPGARPNLCYVEKPEVLEDIISVINSPGERSLKHKPPTTKKAEPIVAFDVNPKPSKNNLSPTEKALESLKEKRDAKFPILLSKVDEATSFLHRIEKEISLHDESEKNKARRQYEDWNTIVHGSIQVHYLPP